MKLDWQHVVLTLALLAGVGALVWFSTQPQGAPLMGVATAAVTAIVAFVLGLFKQPPSGGSGAIATGALLLLLVSCTPAEEQTVKADIEYIDHGLMRIGDAACVAEHLGLTNIEIETLCTVDELVRPQVRAMIAQCRTNEAAAVRGKMLDAGP